MNNFKILMIVSVILIFLLFAFIVIVENIDELKGRVCIEEEVVCYSTWYQPIPPIWHRSYGDCENPHYDKMEKRCIAWKK